MGYNLRKEFLVAHQADVTKLIRLADTDDWQRVICQTPEEAMKVQYHISNILHSLALWDPNHAYVRQKTRTKIEWEPGGKFAVYVGVPPVGMKMRGPKPRPIQLEPETAETGQITFSEEITSANWESTALQLAAAKSKPWIRTVTFEHPPEPEGIKFIADQMAPQFITKQTKPAFILIREHE